MSKKEIGVLDALRAKHSTPLDISRVVKVSRQAIYEILERLEARGLADRYIKDGKKHWRQTDDKNIEEALYGIKRQLLSIPEGVEEVYGVSDSSVIVHRGAVAIRALIQSMFRDNKDQRFYGIQGDVAAIGWNKVFGVESINEMNRWIKKNGLILEGILPYGWFERQTKLLGKKWAEDFEGRAAATHEISEGYFKHGGQIFIFKNSLYLIAMNEEIIIEVRNSEIQKLILSMFRFIQDHSKKFDVNARLRQLIATGEKSEKKQKDEYDDDDDLLGD
ncbi:hypothetical protein HY249_01590 [Candidatus Azambacteria bacterium]|nr:hypothetical protein [Candidatus Azambacteria bacterium]